MGIFYYELFDLFDTKAKITIFDYLNVIYLDLYIFAQHTYSEQYLFLNTYCIMSN